MIKKGFTCLLLIGSAASAFISFNVQAEGNGVIVLNRDVQPIPIGRSGGKDPYPTTVNANPSARINQAMTSTELNDGDFASVASGSSIRGNMITPNSNLPGMNTLTAPVASPEDAIAAIDPNSYADWTAALDLFDEVMHDPAIRLDMMLEPGDIQFANNYAVLHSRNGFEDHGVHELNRKMLRLWVKMPNARTLAPEFPGRNGFPAPAALA